MCFWKKTNTGMKKDITELYSFIDDFCQIYSGYERKQLLPTNKTRNRLCGMALSEIMTIMIMYHTSYAKNFKYFSQNPALLFRWRITLRRGVTPTWAQQPSRSNTSWKVFDETLPPEILILSVKTKKVLCCGKLYFFTIIYKRIFF